MRFSSLLRSSNSVSGKCRNWVIQMALLMMTLSASTYADWTSAIRANDVAQLRQLIPSQVGVDRPAADGKTALMAAAAAGDLELLRSLLAVGADPHLINNRGGSTLIYASWGGNSEVVDSLLEIRAGPGLRQRDDF